MPDPTSRPDDNESRVLEITPEGWFRLARRCPSPNQDARSREDDVDLLVIHNISLPPEEFGGPWIEALFQNRLPADQHPYFSEINQLRVSAHLLIRRDGELVQFVPLGRRAWHAGQSCFIDRESCNDYSIGIELEGSDSQSFSDAQYRTLTDVTRALMAAYPGISPKRIAGHSDIAPGRKTDPGPHFDWQRYRTAIGT